MAIVCFVQAGVEECDDGNDDNTDDCLDTCQAARCGDGHGREFLETCDVIAFIHHARG